MRFVQEGCLSCQVASRTFETVTSTTVKTTFARDYTTQDTHKAVLSRRCDMSSVILSRRKHNKYEVRRFHSPFSANGLGDLENPLFRPAFVIERDGMELRAEDYLGWDALGHELACRPLKAYSAANSHSFMSIIGLSALGFRQSARKRLRRDALFREVLNSLPRCQLDQPLKLVFLVRRSNSTDAVTRLFPSR